MIFSYHTELVCNLNLARPWLVSQPGIQNVKIGKCRDAICQDLLKQSLPRVQQNASRCSTSGGVVIVMVTVKKKGTFPTPVVLHLCIAQQRNLFFRTSIACLCILISQIFLWYSSLTLLLYQLHFCSQNPSAERPCGVSDFHDTNTHSCVLRCLSAKSLQKDSLW